MRHLCAIALCAPLLSSCGGSPFPYSFAVDREFPRAVVAVSGVISSSDQLKLYTWARQRFGAI